MIETERPQASPTIELTQSPEEPAATEIPNRPFVAGESAVIGIGASRTASEQPAIFVISTDGAAYLELEMPAGWEASLGYEYSNGWLAVITGKGGERYDSSGIELTLFQLPVTQPVIQIELFSHEHNAAIQDVGSAEIMNGPLGAMYMAVAEGWGDIGDRQSHWSPEGRYLAFNAAIESNNSEIYAYDTQSDEVVRLTEQPDQATVQGWSPDGDQVIYSISREYVGYPLAAPWTLGMGAVSVTDGGERTLYSESLSDGQIVEILGWDTPNSYILGATQPGSERLLANPHHWLSRVYFRTGGISHIYQGNVGSVSVDPKTGWLGFIAMPDLQQYTDRVDSLTGGLYRVPPRSIQAQRFPQFDRTADALLAAWLPEPDYLVANQIEGRFEGEPGGVTAFKLTGEEIARFNYQPEFQMPIPSPDGLRLAFRTEAENGHAVSLYDAFGKFLGSLSPGASARDLAWLPDSSGLVYRTWGDESVVLYLVSMAGATVAEIAEFPPFPAGIPIESLAVIEIPE